MVFNTKEKVDTPRHFRSGKRFKKERKLSYLILEYTSEVCLFLLPSFLPSFLLSTNNHQFTSSTRCILCPVFLMSVLPTMMRAAVARYPTLGRRNTNLLGVEHLYWHSNPLQSNAIPEAPSTYEYLYVCTEEMNHTDYWRGRGEWQRAAHLHITDVLTCLP